MDNLNWRTTELKLKRYKLTYEFDQVNQMLVLGGFNSRRYQVLLVVLPMTLGLLFSVAALSGIFDEISTWKLWFFTSIGFLAAGYGLFTIKRLKNSNQGEKFISNNKISIQGTTNVEILMKNIESIEYNITSPTKQEFYGEIVVFTKNQEQHVLLGIIGKDNKFLRDDLEYLRNFIISIVEI
jgi:hypothetical protein